MSLFMRGSVWWMELRDPVTGKTFRESTRTKLRKIAETIQEGKKAELALAAAGLSSGRARAVGKTWDDAAERWLIDRVKKRDLKGDRQKLAWLRQHLGGRPLASITRGEVMDVVGKKLAGGVSHSTANRYLALISAILNRAETVWEWLDAAPNFKRTKFDEPEARERWLTTEEIGRLLAELPEHQRAMAGFAFAVGLRQGNVVGLTWDRVFLDKGFCYIDKRTSKGKKSIHVPLGDVARTILAACKGGHERYVFCYRGPFGRQPPRPINRVNTAAWKKALARAGIADFRWHDTRHTWASHCAMNGVSIDTLKEMGGWSSILMPMRYRHLSREHLAAHANSGPQFALPQAQQPTTAEAED